MLFQLFSWHICRIVIMQVLVYAGDMLHVIEHFGYIVTDDDDGALLVDLLQHLVHLLLESAIDWRPLDEITVSLGYAFEKTHVPAPRSIFNIIDGDRNQIAFGATFWLPDSWLNSFNLGFSTAAKFDFYDIRDVEKYEFLFGNPGFPALRFEWRLPLPWLCLPARHSCSSFQSGSRFHSCSLSCSPFG